MEKKDLENLKTNLETAASFASFCDRLALSRGETLLPVTGAQEQQNQYRGLKAETFMQQQQQHGGRW